MGSPVSDDGRGLKQARAGMGEALRRGATLLLRSTGFGKKFRITQNKPNPYTITTYFSPLINHLQPKHLTPSANVELERKTPGQDALVKSVLPQGGPALGSIWEAQKNKSAHRLYGKPVSGLRLVAEESSL